MSCSADDCRLGRVEGPRPRHPSARGGAVPPRWNGGGIEKGLTSPPPVISHARATPLCLRSTEPRVGSRLRRCPPPHGRYGPACRVSPGPPHGLPCVSHH